MDKKIGGTRAVRKAVLTVCAFVGTGLVSLSVAEEPHAVTSYNITRAEGQIKVDGDLSDSGWAHAARIDTWYETAPGDNLVPQVSNVGWLTYDDEYFYAAFEFQDPKPKNIRAPLSERDNLAPSTDYGGVVIDAANDGKTAILFLTTASGVQYDAVSNDATGNEDETPDFFWDSATRITDKGWTLEIRIPFSTLRYAQADPQRWGIMLYRAWPREHRVTMFGMPMRRGANCFVCQAAQLNGLTGLPHGGHWLFTPYASLRQTATPEAGPGSDLKSGSIKFDAGIDAKWTPNADTAVDITLNPDFSQVEADAAQISTNERFALLFPEKRPFFLEGKDLFATPIQAVYTRTVTEPDWGLRATGRAGTTSYTVLAANDIGGGSVVLPGPLSSSFADQDFRSIVGVARLRYDIGRSYLSMLGTTRELLGESSAAYNRVIGPDFGWRPNNSDRVRGQLLFSRSQTPIRPDLATEWDGRQLQSHAGWIDWNHGSPTIDWWLQYRDVGDEFRADNGFVPQVGYRAAFGESGYTFRPKDFFLTRLRLFTFGERVEDRERETISTLFSTGAGMDGGFNSFMRYRYAMEKLRAGDQLIPRNRFVYTAQMSPSRLLSLISIDGYIGDAVDFANARPGHGGSVSIQSILRPTNHLELNLSGTHRWVDVAPGGLSQRLFTARVFELRTTYLFTARAYLRVIGQYLTTERDPSLYTFSVAPHTRSLTATGLFTYKLNWQSVMFVGYGDERAVDNTQIDDGDKLDKVSRQWFLKVSYAFQGHTRR